VASGCSGGDDDQPIPGGALGGALAYFRDDTGLASVIRTDLDEDVLSGLEGRSRSDGRKALTAVLKSGLAQRGISFESVIRPQLGNPLVSGITHDGRQVGAIRVRDPVKLRQDVERLLDRGAAEGLDDYRDALVWKDKRRDPRYAAIHDRELVVAGSENDLKEAIDAASGSENLAFDAPFRAKLASLDRDALVRAVGDAQRLLSTGDPVRVADARKVPWIRALGTLTLTGSVVHQRLRVDFRLLTNRARLSEDDLPLEPGLKSPRLHDPDAPASVGVLGPQQLFLFVEQTLRATDPVRFERYETGVEQLRSILRVNLHRDLVDKIESLSLAAQSATALTFQGDLTPGSGPEFARKLDRAQLFVQGVLNDVLAGTSVESRGIGARKSWIVENRGVTLGRYAVRGDKLIGTVGTAPLPRPVRGTRLRGVTGSLVLEGDAGRIGRLLGFLGNLSDQAFGVVSRLGDLTLGVRTDTDELSASGRVTFGR
jgi:hypothetical protein